MSAIQVVESGEKRESVRTEDDSDDEFQDALDEKDYIPDTNSENTCVTIDQQISSALELANLFFDNDFDGAFQKCKALCGKTLYHTLSYAVFCWLRAWMTFEKPEIENAVKAMKAAVEFSQKKRHPSSVMDMVRTPDYEKYTEEQIHAELAYAESVYMLAMITFVQDQSFVSMVSGALRFRSGFSSYRTCQTILKHRTNWESKLARDEFECGVNTGTGIYNLALSMAPPKVLKILEFIGFSGDKNYGIELLRQAAAKANTSRGSFAIIMLLCYFMYMEVLVGWGSFDIRNIEEVLDTQCKRHPKSVFTLYFQSKYLQFKGRCSDALLSFEKTIKVQSQWKQMHNGVYFEMMWSAALQRDWATAAKYADLMRKQSKWSPCAFTYHYAAFLYMDEEGRSKNFSAMEEALREVPQLKRRLAGKSTPQEKFAVSRSDLYFKKGRLLLPAIEYLYISNYLVVISQSPPLLRDMLELVEATIKTHEKLDDVSTDDRCLLLLLKGAFLRLLNFPLQAQECLLQILKNQEELTHNKYIPPFACLELGYTKIAIGDYDGAKHLFKIAVTKYTKYVSEIIVHIKAHFALKFVREHKSLKVNN